MRQHAFVWDTIPFVLENPWIFDLSQDNLISIFTQAHLANWHPMVLLSHALDFALFGDNSGAHHLMNLAYHILNAGLVYWLTITIWQRLHWPRSDALWLAFLTATIFALHPQHVESVAWVVERKDVLYSAFSLACLISYLHTQNKSWRQQCIPFLLFGCAIASKPMAVTLPAILVLIDGYPLNRINTISDFVRSCLNKLHYWLISGCVILVTLNTQSMAMPDSANLPLAYRALNAIDNSWFYVMHYLWPVNLSPFYPYPASAETMRSVSFWLPGTVFLSTIIGGSCWLWLKGVRWPLVLTGFYLITLSPVSGLIHVGPAKATDHYVYLATLPFSFLTALGFYLAYQKLQQFRFVTGSLAAIYLTFLIAITLPQVSYWGHHLSLWGRVLTLYPESSFAHRNMAAAYVEVGAWQRALAHGELSLQYGSPDVEYVERLRIHVESVESLESSH